MEKQRSAIVQNNPCNKIKSLISPTHTDIIDLNAISEKNCNYADYQNKIVVNKVHNVTKMNEII